MKKKIKKMNKMSILNSNKIIVVVKGVVNKLNYFKILYL